MQHGFASWLQSRGWDVMGRVHGDMAGERMS